MNTPNEAPLIPDQPTEFQTLLTEIKGGWAEVKNLPATLRAIQDENAQLRQHVTDLRRSHAQRSSLHAPRPSGSVSDDCARYLAAQFVVHCERSGKLEALCSLSA